MRNFSDDAIKTKASESENENEQNFNEKSIPEYNRIDYENDDLLVQKAKEEVNKTKK